MFQRFRSDSLWNQQDLLPRQCSNRTWTQYLHMHWLLYWKSTVIHDGTVCSQCVFVHVWGPFTVFQLIIAPSLPCVPSVLSLCGQITSTCHSSSSPILPSLFPSLHPWVSLFIQSDGVGPTCLCLSMWVNMCAHAHTHTRAHTQTLCSPPIYLTQCLYSLAPNWLDRWTDDPSLFAPPLSHTLTDTHNKDMPIGLLQEHECVFRTQFFSPNSIHLLSISVSLHSFNSTKKSIKSSCLTSC